MIHAQSIRSSGNLRAESVQAWIEFMALPEHLRCLQVVWLAPTKAHACVIWMFCERNRALSLIGEEECVIKTSAKRIHRSFGEFFDCSHRAVGQALAELIDDGTLSKRPHVDNVARHLWLNWPVLERRWREAKYPTEQVMMLNFLAKNRAALAVFMHLWQATAEGESWFRKVSGRALAQTMDRFEIAVSRKSIDRAIKSLCDEQLAFAQDIVGPGVARSLALDQVQLQLRIDAFYAFKIGKLWA